MNEKTDNRVFDVMKLTGQAEAWYKQNAAALKFSGAAPENKDTIKEIEMALLDASDGKAEAMQIVTEKFRILSEQVLIVAKPGPDLTTTMAHGTQSQPDFGPPLSTAERYGTGSPHAGEES